MRILSPAQQFNGIGEQSIMRAPSTFQPLSKRFKSDLQFQCMVCNEIFDDPGRRYEHMSSHHGDVYGNGFEHDSDDEISEDLSRLLEPICEIKLIEDDNNDDLHNEPPNVNIVNHQAIPVEKLMGSSDHAINEQLRIQIGLHIQMQLQQQLMQSQMNGVPQLQPQTQPNPHPHPNQSEQIQTTNGNQSQLLPLSIRKNGFLLSTCFSF